MTNDKLIVTINDDGTATSESDYEGLHIGEWCEAESSRKTLPWAYESIDVDWAHSGMLYYARIENDTFILIEPVNK